MKPLQGNLDFFLIRASRGPFRLKHKTEGLSVNLKLHMNIERKSDFERSILKF